ncbi:hypothetical protein NDU88_003705 [Pleurodeles waltl]|uniref:Uncharacterized protein n=1 Tax=Pleurodeles waltl TaxID=8319 RepID=A0AAV7KWB2_PLEWA|nr:hypothetical protein NDU88_003705 [Pleurodeles waltl]
MSLDHSSSSELCSPGPSTAVPSQAARAQCPTIPALVCFPQGSTLPGQPPSPRGLAPYVLFRGPSVLTCTPAHPAPPRWGQGPPQHQTCLHVLSGAGRPLAPAGSRPSSSAASLSRSRCGAHHKPAASFNVLVDRLLLTPGSPPPVRLSEY